MKIAVTGGSGWIGRHLCRALAEKGHQVYVLTRQPRLEVLGAHTVLWPGDVPDAEVTSGNWLQALEGADAVVHLAGTSIAEKRWNEVQKKRILLSRTLSTQVLIEGCKHLTSPPKALISASAVGYYGSTGDVMVTEEHPAGEGFLAEVCQQWEKEAGKAEELGMRVALLRTGIVLGEDGGALKQLMLPFRLYLGGPLGSGKQWMPWIHLQDEVGLLLFLIEHPEASGPFNASSPHPVTNRQFSQVLGRLMKRPSFFRTPAPILRLALGEMADALLLGGQRAIPARAIDLGYRFAYPDLEQALHSLLHA